MDLKNMITLVSRTSRHMQHYNFQGHRQVVGYKGVNGKSIVDEDAIEVLVISSQRKGKGMLFPKGGWEKYESIKEAALREIMEEVGVLGDVDMSALKTANKELKGMMKTVKIQDIDNLQDEMMDLMDVSNEIQESLGRSYSVPDDIDEEELMGELDAMEADMGMETEGDGVPSYLQPDKESDLDAELNLPSAPTGHSPGGRTNGQLTSFSFWTKKLSFFCLFLKSQVSSS
ncbi:Uncharacterized protein Adt_27939 [Abeliophyllum distichum]|uniref:Nudix hydrolase domain-containing protein n=1 Tax=Abeliophyllum distichum TaxID=126358 RepID=A0ABD1RV51_9LAMI